MMVIVPIEMEGSMKCQWITCAAGMGIAGNGRCFLKGQWWSSSCPNYISDAAFEEKMKESPA